MQRKKAQKVLTVNVDMPIAESSHASSGRSPHLSPKERNTDCGGYVQHPDRVPGTPGTPSVLRAVQENENLGKFSPSPKKVTSAGISSGVDRTNAALTSPLARSINPSAGVEKEFSLPGPAAENHDRQRPLSGRPPTSPKPRSGP